MKSASEMADEFCTKMMIPFNNDYAIRKACFVEMVNAYSEERVASALRATNNEHCYALKEARAAAYLACALKAHALMKDDQRNEGLVAINEWANLQSLKGGKL